MQLISIASNRLKSYGFSSYIFQGNCEGVSNRSSSSSLAFLYLRGESMTKQHLIVPFATPDVSWRRYKSFLLLLATLLRMLFSNDLIKVGNIFISMHFGLFFAGFAIWLIDWLNMSAAFLFPGLCLGHKVDSSICFLVGKNPTRVE